MTTEENKQVEQSQSEEKKSVVKNEENFSEVHADKKYGQLSQEMVNYLSGLEYEYFREDKPVPFCGLMVYPATVRQYEMFSNAITCLTLNKNETVQGIGTTNLGYLYLKINDPKEGREWSYKFSTLCEIIFHIKNGIKCKKCREIIEYKDPNFLDFLMKLKEHREKVQDEIKNFKGSQEDFINYIQNIKQQTPPLVCPKCGGADSIEEYTKMVEIIPDSKTKKYSLFIEGHEISSADFNKLRQLVMYQNFSDYVDDSWVDPNLKKDHEEKMRLERAKNDVHATIEKKVVCLSVTTNYKISEIYDMPIRKFALALATVDDLINYKIMRQAVASGFVSLKKGEKIEHWIYKSDKDMYGDSYKSVDQIKNEVSNL